MKHLLLMRNNMADLDWKTHVWWEFGEKLLAEKDEDD